MPPPVGGETAANPTNAVKFQTATDPLTDRLEVIVGERRIEAALDEVERLAPERMVRQLIVRRRQVTGAADPHGEAWCQKRLERRVESGRTFRIGLATVNNDIDGAWTRALGERGWATPTWPKAYGGGGLSKGEAKVLREEMRRAGAWNRP